jgi:hypothetical protein
MAAYLEVTDHTDRIFVDSSPDVLTAVFERAFLVIDMGIHLLVL